MKLSPDILRAAYAFLAETEPFVRWPLPDAEDVVFKVFRAKDRYGDHCVLPDGRHQVRISERNLSHTCNLLEIMAHEMVHVVDNSRADHGASFHHLGRLVCRHHGFDPKRF